jgi:hypothetical protein
MLVSLLAQFTLACGAENYSQILWIILWTVTGKNVSCFEKNQKQCGRLLFGRPAKRMLGLIHWNQATRCWRAAAPAGVGSRVAPVPHII